MLLLEFHYLPAFPSKQSSKTRLDVHEGDLNEILTLHANVTLRSLLLCAPVKYCRQVKYLSYCLASTRMPRSSSNGPQQLRRFVQNRHRYIQTFLVLLTLYDSCRR